MTDTTWRNSFRSGVIALAVAASVQLASADEMSTILGAGCEGPYCAPAANSGNAFSLTQQGTSNSVSAEQQAIAGSASNSASVFQNGAGNAIGLTQTGGQNATGIAQTGQLQFCHLEPAGGRIGVCDANRELSRTEPNSRPEYFDRRHAIWRRHCGRAAGHDQHRQIG